MVQRLQGRLGRDAEATTPPGALKAPPPPPIPAPEPPPLPPGPPPRDTRPVLRPEAKATQKLTPVEEAPRGDADAPAPGRALQAVSPSLMAEGAPPALATTARFLVDDTLPPGTRPRTPVPSLDEPPGTRPRMPVPSLDEPARPAARDVFRGLEKGLMEVEFSGRVFIKQGTIYSYTGNLTFVVKEKRPGVHPWLVIVIGSGRLILTDKDREITFMQVVDEPVFVEPSHLLACEESLKPTYARLGGDEHGLEVVALEGRGMLALSVASKPLPLSVKPGQPVSVPASSVIMWTGELLPHEVDDPEVFAVVLASSATSGRLYRLEGTGRILVEQAAGQ